jgi:hypothetical protein
VKFLYSDTQDYVDPGYDFTNDRNTPGRRRYWDDRYAHELMNATPYDGLLVAMSGVKQVQGVTSTARYSLAEEQRFLRDGARRFLRFDRAKHKEKMLMGDCGAFAYAQLDKPPFSPTEVAEFYSDGGFTHGCSPDHVIFDFTSSNVSDSDVDRTVLERYELTLANASEFINLCRTSKYPFNPIGAIQGWSPASMAEAAVSLEKMGYDYLAVGGLVPLRPDAIHQCLSAIRRRIKPETRLHLLGFAKAEQIAEFIKYNIASFDSTSPLIRAFKDARANYYLPASGGGLQYFAAVRIPQAIENSRLVQAIKRGQVNAEELQQKEQQALAAIREYDLGTLSYDGALARLADYQSYFGAARNGIEQRESELEKSRSLLSETLRAMPWKRCSCSICQQIGVEVIIFRASNRNKRRGFHNLGVFYDHLQQVLKKDDANLRIQSN